MHQRDLVQPEFSTTVRKEDLKKLGLDFQQRTLSLALNTLSLFSPDLSASHALELFSKTRFKSPKRRGIFSQVEPDIINIEGENLAVYHFRGKRLDSPSALLVHGWEGQGSDYYKIVPELLQAGYEVVVFDGPAHGLSSGHSTDMFHFVEVIESLTKYYGNFDITIGHSMGGIAVAMASKLSTIFNPKKMIVMGSPNKLQVVVEKYGKYMSLNKNIIKSMNKQIEKLVGLKIEKISMEKLLRGQPSDLLLIYDIDDKFVPYERAKEITSKVEQANLMTTYGLGHMQILRDPEVIDRIVSFVLGSQQSSDH